MLPERKPEVQPQQIDGPAGPGYAARMRLSDRKIEAMAVKLLRWMEENRDIQFLGSADSIRAAIIDEFRQEKELERELDDEVDRIMSQNESRMRLEGVDTWVMRKKVRQQLARERGIIL